MKKKAVILVSGGIDSSTLLAMIHKMDYEIYAISFNYLQNHLIELDKIREFIKDYNNVKEHRVINIDLRSFGKSALTDDSIKVPEYKNSKDLGDEIPLTYVPARNTIFLSYALAFAEIVGANDIFIGVHASDYANYPDCRPEYINAFEKMANLGTKAGINGAKIKIEAPLIHLNKGQIVAKGLELGVDYSKTISCYNPSSKGESCAKCHACLTRIEAFEKNNISDPINYL